MQILKLLQAFLATTSVALTPPAESVSRPDQDLLTEEYAIQRKAQILDVAYDIHLEFDPKNTETFQGSAKIQVELAHLSEPLTLDLKARSVDEVLIDGAPITDFIVHPGFVEIPQNHLLPKVEITIQYWGEYHRDGSGLSHFIDPQDGKIYLHTNLEPYSAHWVFPCFDQPNLKARFKIALEGPLDWKYVSNEKVQTETHSTDLKKVTFQETHPISTYLVFIGAGAFHQWQDAHGKTPLNIYARESLARYVDADRLFDETKKGLDFYTNYFAYEYPFSKYDHVFSPELGAGAMENPGAITISERMIYRGKVNDSTLRGRTETLVHEMAHIWFGDLVTMNWWSDLWLNESFATFMSALCQSEAFSGELAWRDANSGKDWAYWQDSLSTTHPIETRVVDTDTAFSNFDGITYAKGAASLQQLRHYVGHDAFRDGVRAYFKKFAWNNTTRADFIGEIANAAGHSLQDWTRAWLQSAGVHQIQIEWSCSNGKIDEFTLLQSANRDGVYSPHKTRIGLYRKDGRGKVSLRESIDFSYQGSEQDVTEAIGIACPDFVFPNQEDNDYGLFSLDPKSLQAVRDGLSNFESPFTRQMIWMSLSQMVELRQLSASSYVNFVADAVIQEQDSNLQNNLVGGYDLRDVLNRYIKASERPRALAKLESRVLKRLNSGTLSADGILTYFDFLTAQAESQASLNYLLEALNGNRKLNGQELDQVRRWEVIQALARTNTAGIQSQIQNELAQDPSAEGKLAAFVAQVSIPNLAQKIDFWNQISDLNSPLSSYVRKEAAKAFYSPDHPELTREFVDRYFDWVKTVDWNSSDADTIEQTASGLFPFLCEQAILDRSETELQTLKNELPWPAQRSWIEANDMMRRCIEIQR